MSVVKIFVLVLALVGCCGIASAQTASTGCGGTSQPRCQIVAPTDQATEDYKAAIQGNETAWDEYSKSQVNTPSNRFQWTFIPQIPTAQCVNPLIENPLKTGAVEMDVCGPVNTFGAFINGVLAFFCLIGCVAQIRQALAVR